MAARGRCAVDYSKGWVEEMGVRASRRADLKEQVESTHESGGGPPPSVRGGCDCPQSKELWTAPYRFDFEEMQEE